MISVPLAAEVRPSPATSAAWCAYTTRNPASASQPSCARVSFGMRPPRALMMRVTTSSAMTMRTAARMRASMYCVRYLTATMFRPHVAMTNISCR